MEWRKSTYSVNGNCVGVAYVKSSSSYANGCVKVGFVTSTHSGGNACVACAVADEHVHVRDSKDPDGPILTFNRNEWQAFLAGVRNGEFEF